MRLNRIRNALFASAFAAAALSPLPRLCRQHAYDGLLERHGGEKTGSCEPSVSSTLIVTDGKVSAGGAAVFRASRKRGTCAISINGAYANGHLNGQDRLGK